jgi:hypothetical protein
MGQLNYDAIDFRYRPFESYTNRAKRFAEFAPNLGVELGTPEYNMAWDAYVERPGMFPGQSEERMRRGMKYLELESQAGEGGSARLPKRGIRAKVGLAGRYAMGGINALGNVGMGLAVLGQFGVGPFAMPAQAQSMPMPNPSRYTETAYGYPMGWQ